ncbi:MULTISPECIES: hypothetical protein [Vibrio]|uniref:hypothetical protein n=1 Tax=Vibrio TaxID=662 RepID=UPI0005FA34E0|nr:MULTISPECIES: hypothetical protein [Vibrio]KJY93696.1 hypothetical protein TW84_02785 [Vibrio neptunius]MDA0117531.1 hypothetical protein [Vibrio sp. T11.5]
MEIGGYDEYRYEQLRSVGVGNLAKRLKYLKINEAAEKECMDALLQMAMNITQASYRQHCRNNSPTEWINMLRGFVNQFKVAQSMRHTWSLPQSIRSKVNQHEAQALVRQMEMVTALSFYTFNSSSLNTGMTGYTTKGKRLDDSAVNVWNSYKEWRQNSTSHVDVPVYRQITVPNPQNSAWWKYANDIVNGRNPKGPAGTIKSSRYLSCSFHKGFIEGACFPVYKNTEGILNFIIRRAQGVNISAFSGYNSTNLASRLDNTAVRTLNITDTSVKTVSDYEKKYVNEVIEQSKTLIFEYRRINKMKQGYENLAKLMGLKSNDSAIAVQAEFLLPPSAQLSVDRIVKKPAYPGAANVPVLEVHCTYVRSTEKSNGLPQVLAPSDQSMFLGPINLYPAQQVH